MRQLATGDRIRRLLRALGRVSRRPSTLYLTGGATAVLLGWRESTIDVDLKLVPDSDELLRAIRDLKEELEINIELASPDLFIPVAGDWQEASPWETTEGTLTVRHFDLRAQALAKIERGHERDLGDVEAMLTRGLVSARDLWLYFEAIEPDLYRFPAIDGPSLRNAVAQVIGPRPTWT